MDDVIKILIIIVVFVGSFPRHGSNLQSVFKHNERLPFDEILLFISVLKQELINVCTQNSCLLLDPLNEGLMKYPL